MAGISLKPLWVVVSLFLALAIIILSTSTFGYKIRSELGEDGYYREKYHYTYITLGLFRYFAGDEAVTFLLSESESNDLVTGDYNIRLVQIANDAIIRSEMNPKEIVSLYVVEKDGVGFGKGYEVWIKTSSGDEIVSVFSLDLVFIETL